MTDPRPRGLAFAAALSLLLVSLARPAPAVDGFLSLVEDLPLMSGLTEDTAAGLGFDTADGRIVDFYGETLPQLGWKAEGKTQFARNGERLRLEFTHSGGGLMVHYSLSPH